MRIVVFSLIAIPLLIVDAVLLFTLPGPLASRLTTVQWGVAMCGAAVYLAVHFLLRKPERLYLWGHELTHLIVAKLFLRQVHGFHITSRTGGKVVIDRTNVAIDLAPYAVPLYSLAAIVPFVLWRGQFDHIREIYLSTAAFLFTMHLSFSFEGFLHGQPDLLRSGRMFSAAVVLFFLLLWIPFLWAPTGRSGFQGALDFYRDWLDNFLRCMKHLQARLGPNFLF